MNLARSKKLTRNPIIAKERCEVAFTCKARSHVQGSFQWLSRCCAAGCGRITFEWWTTTWQFVKPVPHSAEEEAQQPLANLRHSHRRPPFHPYVEARLRAEAGIKGEIKAGRFGVIVSAVALLVEEATQWSFGGRMVEKSRQCTQQDLLLQLLLSNQRPKGDCAREAPEWHNFTQKIQETMTTNENINKRTMLMMMSRPPGSMIKATKRRRKFWKTESLR
jgi:hypothetical protein